MPREWRSELAFDSGIANFDDLHKCTFADFQEKRKNKLAEIKNFVTVFKDWIDEKEEEID